MDKKVWLVLVAVFAYLLSLTPCDSGASEPESGSGSVGKGDRRDVWWRYRQSIE